METDSLMVGRVLKVILECGINDFCLCVNSLDPCNANRMVIFHEALLVHEFFPMYLFFCSTITALDRNVRFMHTAHIFHVT